MCVVGGRPTKEAPGPVPLAGLMVGDELVVVNGTICFVLSVGAVDATIVGQT